MGERAVGERAVGERAVGRRGLAVAVLLCAAGAGLALFAATRTWAVEVTSRPAPLPDLRTTRGGPDWLTAVAVVALAAAGALVATRGAARQALGVLLVLLGAGIMVGGAGGPSGLGVWPGTCLGAGLAVCIAGVNTLRLGRSWPTMGVRYERVRGVRYERVSRPGSAGLREGPARQGDAHDEAGGDEAGGAATSDRSAPAAQDGSVASVQAWDALDRGEDPTLR